MKAADDQHTTSHPTSGEVAESSGPADDRTAQVHAAGRALLRAAR